MSKKKGVFITTMVGVAATAAVATITYLELPIAAQLNGAVTIAATAITDIVMLFVKKEGADADSSAVGK